MATIESFDELILQKLCDVLADTEEGLTNTEIERLLKNCQILDAGPFQPNKRTRLFIALSTRQRQDKCGNNVAAFVVAAMSPVRYAGNSEQFESRRQKINAVLLFSGYQLGKDGKLYPATAARTLPEAEQRAKRLIDELSRRGVHVEVLRYCRAELLQEDCFHAVLEAAKSIAIRIKEKAGVTGDGHQLVEDAFGKAGGPRLVFNSLQTQTERDEHNGFAYLLKAVFSMFRNPTAHEPRIHYSMSEQDALDLFTTLSLIHRRLDRCVRTSIPSVH